VLLWDVKSICAIVVVGSVDVVSGLWVILRLPYIPRFVLGQDAVVTAVGPLRKPPRSVLTVQNRAQVHRKPTGDLEPFSPRRVLPRFVNPRIRSKLLGFSI
jgi:hypothetical protein